jgi:DNA-binding MarR family transcriptional regulator
MADELTDQDRKMAGALGGVIGAIISGMQSHGHKSPPVFLIKAFLLVSIEEGLSVLEYAERGKMQVSSMSRHLLDLGDRNRRGEPGMRLITSRANLLDRRRREYMLTAKGHAHLENLGMAMQRVKDA